MKDVWKRCPKKFKANDELYLALEIMKDPSAEKKNFSIVGDKLVVHFAYADQMKDVEEKNKTHESGEVLNKYLNFRYND